MMCLVNQQQQSSRFLTIIPRHQGCHIYLYLPKVVRWTLYRYCMLCARQCDAVVREWGRGELRCTVCWLSVYCLTILDVWSVHCKGVVFECKYSVCCSCYVASDTLIWLCGYAWNAAWGTSFNGYVGSLVPLPVLVGFPWCPRRLAIDFRIRILTPIWVPCGTGSVG